MMNSMEKENKPGKLVKMAVTEEEFRDLVVSQKLSDVALALKLNVCNVTIRNWRNRFGLLNAYAMRGHQPIPPRRPRRKLYLTPEQLRDLYIVQGLSQRGISLKYGVNQVTISNWLRKYGIPARPYGGRPGVSVPENELNDLYTDQHLSMEQIAKHFRCNPATVRRNLVSYGIKILGPLDGLRRKWAENQANANFRYEHRGYVSVRQPDNPGAGKNGYVLEHKAVAEAAIGRLLGPGEQVHHINFRKRDNRIENLAVLPTPSDHSLVHRYMEKVGAYFCGLGAIRPEPMDFGSPVFWGGAWVTTIDLIQGVEHTPCQTPLVDQASKGDAAVTIN